MDDAETDRTAVETGKRLLEAFIGERTTPLFMVGVRAEDAQFRMVTTAGLRKCMMLDPALIDRIAASVRHQLHVIATSPLDDLDVKWWKRDGPSPKTPPKPPRRAGEPYDGHPDA